MKRPSLALVALTAVGLAACGMSRIQEPVPTQNQPTPSATGQGEAQKPRYERRAVHDPDGTGIFYMGREIAQVMGHQGAAWLDRPERYAEEAPQILLNALGLKPGMTVADIGAGSGYLTFPMAQRVGPTGKVLAVDIQPEMLQIIQRKARQARLKNVVPVLGTPSDPKVPEGTADLMLLVDVYHEFDKPYEMTEAMVRGLKKGGRLVFVEYRAEDPRVPIKPVHKMTEAQVRKEMALFPLEWKQTLNTLPRQHIIVFEKK